MLRYLLRPCFGGTATGVAVGDGRAQPSAADMSAESPSPLKQLPQVGQDAIMPMASLPAPPCDGGQPDCGATGAAMKPADRRDQTGVDIVAPGICKVPAIPDSSVASGNLHLETSMQPAAALTYTAQPPKTQLAPPDSTVTPTTAHPNAGEVAVAAMAAAARQGAHFVAGNCPDASSAHALEGPGEGSSAPLPAGEGAGPPAAPPACLTDGGHRAGAGVSSSSDSSSKYYSPRSTVAWAATAAAANNGTAGGVGAGSADATSGGHGVMTGTSCTSCGSGGASRTFASAPSGAVTVPAHNTARAWCQALTLQLACETGRACGGPSTADDSTTAAVGRHTADGGDCAATTAMAAAVATATAIVAPGVSGEVVVVGPLAMLAAAITPPLLKPAPVVPTAASSPTRSPRARTAETITAPNGSAAAAGGPGAGLGMARTGGPERAVVSIVRRRQQRGGPMLGNGSPGTTGAAALEPAAGSRPSSSLFPRLCMASGCGGGGVVVVSGDGSRPLLLNSMSEPVLSSGAASGSAAGSVAAALAPAESGVGDALHDVATTAAAAHDDAVLVDTFLRLQHGNLDLLTTTHQLQQDTEPKFSTLTTAPDIAPAAAGADTCAGGYGAPRATAAASPGGGMAGSRAPGVVAPAAAAEMPAAAAGRQAGDPAAPHNATVVDGALARQVPDTACSRQPAGSCRDAPSDAGIRPAVSGEAGDVAAAAAAAYATASSAVASGGSSVCTPISSWQAGLTHMSSRASPLLLGSLYTRQHTWAMATSAAATAGPAAGAQALDGPTSLQGTSAVADAAAQPCAADADAVAPPAAAVAPQKVLPLEHRAASLQPQTSPPQDQQHQQQPLLAVVPAAPSAQGAPEATRAGAAATSATSATTSGAVAGAAADDGAVVASGDPAAAAAAGSAARITALAMPSAAEGLPSADAASAAAGAAAAPSVAADPAVAATAGRVSSTISGSSMRIRASWLMPPPPPPFPSHLSHQGQGQQQQLLLQQHFQQRRSPELSLGSFTTSSSSSCSLPQPSGAAAWAPAAAAVPAAAGTAAAGAAVDGAGVHALPPPPVMLQARAPTAPGVRMQQEQVEQRHQGERHNYGGSSGCKGGKRSQLLQYYWGSVLEGTEGTSAHHRAAVAAIMQQQQQQQQQQGPVAADVAAVAAAAAAAAAAGPPAAAAAMMAALGPGGEPRVPLSALASLDIARLSREVSALVWIGQGGGGAVFQGLWQGARVAVKFLLAASPAHVDATALEAIVSLSVAHPNVVHTYCAEVARVDEASLAEPAAGAHGRGGYAAGGGAGGFDSNTDPPTQALMRMVLGSLASAHDDLAGSTSLTAAAAAGAGATAAAPAARAAGGEAPSPPPVHGPQVSRQSLWESNEGFGEPDLTKDDRAWSLRQVLNYLKARPQMYLTHIIMEYCDRGSLLGAIKRGIFRLEAQGVTEGSFHSSLGASGGSNAWSQAAGAGSGDAQAQALMGLGATTQQLQQARVQEAHCDASRQRFPRRVVLRAILRTARDVSQGMAHLHANGIIHGDLKPGNVLLRGCRSDRRGFVAAVADFGLSKVVRGDQPLELDRWSTVTVMAPETIQGRWHKASDVYAFGILLWQLVSNEVVPYGNLTVGQILLGVSQGTLRPEWPTCAHPALIRLGRACLATNANERPGFDAIAKVLTKIETGVRNELREQQRQQQRTQHEQQQ